MGVKIMIDSASDINKKEANDLGFLFTPIQVRLENEEYFDESKISIVVLEK